jgi:DNA-binding transcriptional LysR family regulator
VVPTDAGARLFEAGKAIQQICNTELETIARPKVLRIGIPQSFSNRYVANLLGSFRRLNSHMAIEVSDGSSEQLVELLAERQLDAVLTILDDDVAFALSGDAAFLLTRLSPHADGAGAGYGESMGKDEAAVQGEAGASA